MSSFSEGDKQLLDLSLKSIKNNEKISLSQFLEFRNLKICNEPSPHSYKEEFLLESKLNLTNKFI